MQLFVVPALAVARDRREGEREPFTMLYLGLTSPLGRPGTLWWTISPSHTCVALCNALARFPTLRDLIVIDCFLPVNSLVQRVI